MPELPEVESIRRSLSPWLEGRTVVACEILHPRMTRRGAVAQRLVGRRVEKLGRRGKFLLAELESGDVWLTHLGMSGRVEVADARAPTPLHTRVVVRADDGREFRLIDPRTFGFVQVVSPEELPSSGVGRLGPDALDDLPSVAALEETLRGRRAPIKAVLLDQRVTAGIGNIYADEILHRARLAPWRAAGSLHQEEVRRLRSSVRPVLREGLRWSGTSLGDLSYLLPDGRAGEFASRLRAYGREGLRCPRCGNPIRRTVIRGRSAFWCPGCQI